MYKSILIQTKIHNGLFIIFHSHSIELHTIQDTMKKQILVSMPEQCEEQVSN